MLIVNFKNYPQVLGDKDAALAKELELVAREFPRLRVVLAISPLDIHQVAEAASLPVYSQHVDPAGVGQTTGHIAPESARAAGALGTLVNHSDHPLEPGAMVQTVSQCREVGLVTVVCVSSVEELRGSLETAPDFLAYEPPELIGGEISVTSAQPEIIAEAVSAAGETPLLVGAGIHSGEDVRVALSLGAVGVLVSSAIVLADDPACEFRDIAQGFSASALQE